VAGWPLPLLLLLLLLLAGRLDGWMARWLPLLVGWLVISYKNSKTLLLICIT